jgi:hypothetical protein
MRFSNFSRLLPLLLGVILAAMTLAMLTGCGSTTPATAATTTSSVAAPSISPGTGTYAGTQAVTISDTTPGATIYYSTDGTVPTASSPAYTGPISIAVSSTVQAIAFLDGSASAVASSTLTITSAHPPAKLVFLQQPSNALTGATISPAVQVVVEDANGNAVTSATNPVTLALTGGASLGGTLTITAQNGVATFSNLSVSTAGSYMLSATSSGLTSATSTSFTISVAGSGTSSPATLAFLVQPSNALTQTTITPAVQVLVQDTNGNTVTTATNPVTLTLSGGTGLGGTLTVTSQNGIATFSNLTVSAAGSYTLSATSTGLTSATSTSFTITIPSSTGTTYYLSPSGNDSNSGLSASLPWLSPNHPLNCGDTILAASGSYSAANFQSGKWGTVTCSAGNNVAWLQCATFDTCQISATTEGVYVDESYWGVEGWEVTTNTTPDGACFTAAPRFSAPVNIHHIIFANNVANGCMGSGFNQYDLSTTASVDYVAIVGNIAYNAAQGSDACYSGIGIYQPIASDTNAGTHMFIAGNFSYGNNDPARCAGAAPTDGEGIIVDTLDFSQGGGTPYTQQVYVENNILVNNGGRGIEVFNNSAGSSHAAVYITQNTSWGNLTDPNQKSLGCGEILLSVASNTQVNGNLISTNSATGCGGNPIYALSVQFGDSTDSVNNNFAFGYNGNNTYLLDSGTFAYGSNNSLGIAPDFSDATSPGAPNCQNASNVTNCMAPLIADFAPTAASTQGFGYQTPSSTPSSDPLFPQWLCSVNLPSGLVTMGCKAGP